MPLRKLQIVPVDQDAEPLVVDYMPEEYALANENTYAVQGVPGLGSPIVQFVNGAQRTLDVELFFDTYDTPDLRKADVRPQTDPVLALMDIDGERHAPPILQVTMASLDLTCVLSRC